MQIQQVIPVLRIMDVAKAREFYADYLDFAIDWEHRYGDDFPLYMQVSRDGIVLHLTEHHGDCVPGGCVFLRITGLAALHAELAAKNYRYNKAGIENTGHGSRSMQLLDPFGNKLRFDEKIA